MIVRWHTSLFCDRESLPNDTIQFPRTWCKRGLKNSLFTFKNASTWLYVRNINRDVMLLCSADDGGVSAVHAEGNSLKESRRSAKPLYIMRNPKSESRDIHDSVSYRYIRRRHVLARNARRNSLHSSSHLPPTHPSIQSHFSHPNVIRRS
jgi:hypothetical protein